MLLRWIKEKDGLLAFTSLFLLIEVKKIKVVITIVVPAVVAASVSLALVTLAILKRKRMLKSFGDLVEGLTLIKTDIDREDNQIGEEPSAIVYRAVSRNGTVEAVKARRDMAPQTKLEEEILLKSSSQFSPKHCFLTGICSRWTPKKIFVLSSCKEEV